MRKLLVVCFSIISFHGNTQLTNKNEPLSEYVQQDDEKKITKASIVLIGKSVQGFKKLKLAKHNQLGDEKWYKAKPNSKMISTEQFIIEKNGKTCYCANYYGARDEYNSLKAFFEIPSAIVSTIPLALRKDEIINIYERYSLFMGERLIASYTVYIEPKHNSIQIFEPGY